MGGFCLRLGVLALPFGVGLVGVVVATEPDFIESLRLSVKLQEWK